MCFVCLLYTSIVAQVVEHGDKAVAAIDKAAAAVTRNKEEFGRLQKDVYKRQVSFLIENK